MILCRYLYKGTAIILCIDHAQNANRKSGIENETQTFLVHNTLGLYFSRSSKVIAHLLGIV